MFTYWMLICIVIGSAIIALALFCAYKELYGRMILCILLAGALPCQMMLVHPGVPALEENLIVYDDSPEAEAARQKIIEHAQEIEAKEIEVGDAAAGSEADGEGTETSEAEETSLFPNPITPLVG